jgi:hypothetical protein
VTFCIGVPHGCDRGDRRWPELVVVGSALKRYLHPVIVLRAYGSDRALTANTPIMPK